jgi:hypothetical protein
MGTHQWEKGQGACGISAGCEALKFSRTPTKWALKGKFLHYIGFSTSLLKDQLLRFIVREIDPLK